jgi:hypothetical protein
MDRNDAVESKHPFVPFVIGVPTGEFDGAIAMAMSWAVMPGWCMPFPYPVHVMFEPIEDEL